jgi:hypothetical protein
MTGMKNYSWMTSTLMRHIRNMCQSLGPTSDSRACTRNSVNSRPHGHTWTSLFNSTLALGHKAMSRIISL